MRLYFVTILSMIKIVNCVLLVVAIVFMIIGLSYRVEEPENLESDTLIMYRFINNLPYTAAPGIVGEYTPDCPKGAYPLYKVKIVSFTPTLVEKVCS